MLIQYSLKVSVFCRWNKWTGIFWQLTASALFGSAERVVTGSCLYLTSIRLVYVCMYVCMTCQLPPTSLGLFYQCSCLLFPGVCLESCCLRVHCVYLGQHLTSQRWKLCHACLDQWWPMAAHTPSCKALPTYLYLKYTRTHFVMRGLCHLMHLLVLLSLF